MYATDTPLPDWLDTLPGKPGSYIADPNKFYPVILKFMGMAPKTATRFDMETANGVAKKLSQWHARRCKHGPCGTLLIRGDEGRKAKWAIRRYPLGDKPDISGDGATAARNGAVRAVWARLMG